MAIRKKGGGWGGGGGRDKKKGKRFLGWGTASLSRPNMGTPYSDRRCEKRGSTVENQLIAKRH